MKDLDHKADQRYRNAVRRLGTHSPVCCGCGERYPHCLELHHIAGRAFGEEQVIICRNCHRKQSDLQQGHPVQLSEPPNLLETIGHYLLGLADIFQQAADKLSEYGFYLISVAEAALAALRGGRA